MKVLKRASKKMGEIFLNVNNSVSKKYPTKLNFFAGQLSSLVDDEITVMNRTDFEKVLTKDIRKKRTV